MTAARCLVLAALLCACAPASPPPAPAPLDMHCADAVIGQKVSYASVPVEVLDARLDALQPRNDLREQTLERLFREAGCDELLEPQPIARSKLPNLICRLPGRSPRVIVVGAHYDKVDVGDGAADNWSGAALLPSLYESLRSSERLHTYEFVAFTDEEQGLVGSDGYVEQLAPEQLERIAAMVNLDTLGLGPLNLDTATSSPRLSCLFVTAVDMLAAPLQLVDATRIGTSDFQSFARAGIPVVSLHSLTQKSFPILHSRRDRLSAIDRSAYRENYRAVALYLTLLDLALAAPPAPEAAPTLAEPNGGTDHPTP